MKKILILLLILLIGCGTPPPVCKNETIIKEIEVIKEIPIEKVIEKTIYINNTKFVCNDSIYLSLTRRLKHCNDQQFKYINSTECEFDLIYLNQTLNTTKILLTNYKNNQSECLRNITKYKEELAECKNELDICNG